VNLPNLKFVALPVPEIIGGSQKIWAAPWIRPRSLFFTRSHDVVVKFDTIEIYSGIARLSLPYHGFRIKQ